MKIVLFLGAGFSAPLNYPVMSNFLTFAQNSPVITDEDQNFLDDLVLDARRANSFLQSRPTNLEDILSFAVMADRLVPFQKNKNTQNISSRLPRIKRIIQRIYSQPSEENDFWYKFDDPSKLLGLDIHNSKHLLSIITTNYDLNIESALNRFGMKVDPGFPAQHSHNNDYYSSNGIPLFKLHGSVNWYENIYNDEYYIVDERVDIYDERDDHDEETPRTPLIIPPSFLKPDFKGPMQQIWANASLALENAEIVVFVGYSFPATDTEMRYFLAKSFVNNPRLHKIKIVDLIADNIVERLKESSSGFGSHFQELLKPIQGDWSTLNLDIAR